MTKRQKYLKIYAPELLRIAKSDLESAKILNAASNSRPETPSDVEAAIGVGLKIIEWAQTIIK